MVGGGEVHYETLLTLARRADLCQWLPPRCEVSKILTQCGVLLVSPGQISAF
jgi:hypothetical protein